MLGIPPGVPIQEFSVEAGRAWNTPKHGYSPSINHQIHCLVSNSFTKCRGAEADVLSKGWIKHYLMPSGSSEIDYEHAGHCVEYIRHVR